jgi:hypothetical protein
MTPDERLAWLQGLLSSTDGQMLIDELMSSYVLDDDFGVIEERGAIEHPWRAYYEAGQRSVVLRLRLLGQLKGATDE